MPSRSLRSSCLSWVKFAAFLCWVPSAWSQTQLLKDAAPLAPYEQQDLGGGSYAVYYAGYQTTPTAGLQVDTDVGFGYYDLDLTQSTGTSSDAIYFDVTLNSAPAAGKRHLVLVKVDGQLVPIAYAGTSNGVSACSDTSAPCQATPPTGYSSSYSWAARYSGDLTVRVGLFPKDVCYFVNNAAGSSSTGCSGGAINFPTSGPATLSVAFYVVENADDETTPLPATLTTAGKTLSVRFMPYASNPALSACADSTDRYRPGDGAIEVNTSKLELSTTVTGAPPINSTIAIGKIGSDADTSDLSNNDVVSRLAYGDWERISGLVNSTDLSSPVKYYFAFGLRDYAGVYTTPACELRGVVVSDVQGFLAQDRCFIASAAFGSREAGPVRMLRLFRDRWLLTSGWGRSWIEAYYTYSPALASWVKARPWARAGALFLLGPVQVLAYFLLHPALYWVMLVGLVLWGLGGRRKRLALMSLVGAFLLVSTARAQESGASSQQPYIDRLIRTLPPAEGPAGSADGDSRETYIRKLRKEADRRHEARLKEGNVPREDQSYSEQIRQKLLEEEETEEGPASESYTEQQKKMLEKVESKSAIDQVKTGDSTLKLKRPGSIHFAAGMKLGVSMNRSVSANAGLVNTAFTQVYGSSWVPDLQLFGEYQPFHSEWLGNIGFVAGGGFAVYKGVGAFALQLPIATSVDGVSLGNFSSNSDVNLQFLTLPAYVGVNYRFNLLRLLRPYVQVAPTLIGYREGRSDRQNAYAGISKALQMSGGVSLMLDWFSRRSSWELYETGGIKHYYLTLDYTKLVTVASAMKFDFSGFSGGFTFEF